MPSSEPAAYRAGDVVVLPFPFSDQFAEKRRPALVISGAFLAARGLHWVAMITSRRPETWSGDVEIDDLTKAGLRSPSVIRTAKIAYVEPARMIRRAGRVKEAILMVCLDRIKTHLYPP